MHVFLCVCLLMGFVCFVCVCRCLCVCMCSCVCSCVSMDVCAFLFCICVVLTAYLYECLIRLVKDRLFKKFLLMFH